MRQRTYLFLLILSLAPAALRQESCGSDLDTIGVTALRQFDPALVGTGVHVAQPEAGSPYWQVNPAAVGQPESLFTWIAQGGTATSFPNSLGFESGHANQVGGFFYGGFGGVAPAVAHVDSYEAQFFYTNFVVAQNAIPARIVNQSFIFLAETATVELVYDHYADMFGTLFVSGIGNGGPVSAPATCYNGIGVAAFGGLSSIGPTLDGRSKPDIAAPAIATSYSTPLVAGAAAILRQAAQRNDAGPDTASAASDPRTIKALLLNGARKTPGWTHTQTSPLDPNFGAGLLDAYASYGQLRAGKQGPASTTTFLIGGPHLPPASATYTRLRRGWDFNTISASVTRDAVNHYCFEVTAAAPREFTFSGTVTWHRHSGETMINDLNLFLYNTDSNLLVASSESLVDNVEHICATNLPPGRYNLQVFKRGGPPLSTVSSEETYALAFEFGPPETARFANVQHATGQFAARLLGESEHPYVIQRALDFETWTPALTNTTSAAGHFDFSIPESGLRGFYRALRIP
jgi:hypothetical protein